MLELDRGVGQKAMEDAGIETIPSRVFHDYDDAIAFVKCEGRAFVSKPSGDAAKALSYVAHDAADLTYMLKRWKKNDAYRADARKNGFILQDKVDGCEMAVGGWYGPGGWSRWWCQNFEHKKLMNGNLGPNTGEMGTVVRYVRACKLARQVLEPIGPQLDKLGYVGYVDNNCIIDASGKPWPLEWTMRPGWPIFHNQVALHKGDPVQWMLDLIDGRDTLDVSLDVCVSVVVAIPDFPYSKLTNKEVCGVPIYNATDREHIHLSEAMLADDVPTMVGNKVTELPGYVTSGDYPLVATGTGTTISGARRSAYAAVRKVHIPNSPFYRTDIGGGQLLNRLAAIQAHGYARGLTV
jgi:phosphoribosylamine--glycine ligase